MSHVFLKHQKAIDFLMSPSGIWRPCDVLIYLFLDNDSFLIAYHISLVNIQTNYCNNNVLILDVKQLNKIMKLYYFYTLKALWDGQGKSRM